VVVLSVWQHVRKQVHPQRRQRRQGGETPPPPVAEGQFQEVKTGVLLLPSGRVPDAIRWCAAAHLRAGKVQEVTHA
jgi:hypothetical protein